MDSNIVGWDIGGAHLKAAWLNPDGEVLAVFQEPCPLWQGINTLEIALSHIIEQLPVPVSRHDPGQRPTVRHRHHGREGLAVSGGDRRCRFRT